MLGINPMDVPLYVESFQKKGRLVIDNILETSAAERVGDFLKTMPEDWWFASTLPNRDLNDEMEVHRCDKSNNYYIEKARNAACHALDYNRFSYSFFRKCKHYLSLTHSYAHTFRHWRTQIPMLKLMHTLSY